MDNDTSGRII